MGIAIIVKYADFSSNNIGKVTPTNIVELVSLSIVGPDSVEGDAHFEAAYSPKDTTQRGVTWSIESGSQYASIDPNTGILTALQGANSNDVTIKVTSKVDASISAQKIVSVTFPRTLYWNDLLFTNQTQYRVKEIGSGLVDGWSYKYLYANDDSKIGKAFSTVVGGEGDRGAVQFFKIPVEGFSKVNAPVMKSTSGYGYVFTDNDDIIKGLYLNTTIDTSTYLDITIPNGATYLYLPVSPTLYSSLGKKMQVERIY
jgi:hypothetical protein